MQGKIVGLNCGTYFVRVNDSILKIPAKGIFRIKSNHPTVGDDVIVDEKSNVISKLLERKNSLIRPAICNIDQLIIVQSWKTPDFSLGLLLKFITYANLNNVQPVVLITKSDLISSKEEFDEILNLIKFLKIKYYVVSKSDIDSISLFKDSLKNKVSCLMGQTGVGKSSVLNLIDSSFNRAVGEYSSALHRGKHKTKDVTLVPYEGGYIADTPGFSSLELPVYKKDLVKFFPGISEVSEKCFFNDCVHINEKKCAVKEAVKLGQIPEEIYNCYVALYKQLPNKEDLY